MTTHRELRVALDMFTNPLELEFVGEKPAEDSPNRIANISKEGMFIAGATAGDLSTGRNIQFAIGSTGGSTQEVRGVALVRWVRDRSNGPEFPRGAGVQILEFFDNSEKQFFEYLESCLLNLKVSDLMHKSFPTVYPDTSVRSAVELLDESKAKLVMVTDAQGKLLGTITSNELPNILLNADLKKDSVEKFLVRDLPGIEVTDGLDSAYTLLRAGQTECIPVLEDDIVVGVVSMNTLVPLWSEFMELQARRLSRNYERAMSIMAHDLRSPISTIKTSNLLLTSGELEPEEYFNSGFPEVLEHSCDLMLTLIDDILDTEKLRVGSVRLEKKLCDIEDLIERVVRNHRPPAAVKDISIDIDIPSAVPKAMVDPRRLEQVLNNLIANAIKFSPDSSQVVVGLKRHHSNIALWIADNGPGIPEKELNRLFREFSPASVRPTRGEPSHGLGLAISRRLVEAHDGSIRVDSEVGVGSTFTVFIPIGTLQ